MSDTIRLKNTFEHMGSERSKAITVLQLGRIQTTIAMIPQGVSTILDVGCGDGRVVESIRDKYRTIGVDYAYTSVMRLDKNGVQASSASLPFQNKSFDLVLCCEVLEHLPNEILKKTLGELERVSKKHILVSVPYKENLSLRYIRCSRCHTIFHIWGHLRSFSNGDMADLFTRFRENDTRYFGKREPYRNGFVTYVNQRFGNRWADAHSVTMCPKCENAIFDRTGRNIITISCGVINLLTSKLIPVSQKNWVFKRYSIPT